MKTAKMNSHSNLPVGGGVEGVEAVSYKYYIFIFFITLMCESKL